MIPHRHRPVRGRDADLLIVRQREAKVRKQRDPGFDFDAVALGARNRQNALRVLLSGTIRYLRRMGVGEATQDEANGTVVLSKARSVMMSPIPARTNGMPSSSVNGTSTSPR